MVSVRKKIIFFNKIIFLAKHVLNFIEKMGFSSMLNVSNTSNNTMNQMGGNNINHNFNFNHNQIHGSNVNSNPNNNLWK